MELNRRNFLKGAAFAGVAAAGAGLAGCAPSTSAETAGGDAAAGGMPIAESGASAGPDVAGLHSWEIAPEAIPEGDIVSTE